MKNEDFQPPEIATVQGRARGARSREAPMSVPVMARMGRRIAKALR